MKACGLLTLGLLVVGCDGADDWSRLRDALTLGRGDAQVIARTAAAAFEPIMTVAASGVERVRVVDRARALAGTDALVAARYTMVADTLVADDCGPLFVAGAADVQGWLARCGDGDAATVEVVPGMPTLVAWLPDEGRLLVHPVVARAEVGLTRAALSDPVIDPGPDCQADLQAWCERCPSGTETGCEPLFGPASEPVDCAALDVAMPAWRTTYCVWRAIESQADVRLVVAELDYETSLRGGTPCWDPTVRVTGAAELMLAFPGWSFACQREVDRALSFELPVAFVANGELGRGPIGACAGWVEHVYCVACGDDPAGACAPLFDGSSVATACFDLRRAEIHGGGFVALCASGRLRDDYQQCLNAYDPCAADNDVGGSPGGLSFEVLARLLPGFFDRHLAERCTARAAQCDGNDPLPDFDPNATVPTPLIEGAGADTGGDEKCPL